MDDVATDLESHHIEGYAIAAQQRGIPSHFDIPIISHITGNLWMGGCKDYLQLPYYFDYVVSLYPWEKYRLFPHTERQEYELFDSAEIPDVGQLFSIASTVSRMMKEGNTLVHCQAGLNRSGLISALTLMQEGRTAQEAIDLLRFKRSPLVLCNQTFEQWLLGQ